MFVWLVFPCVCVCVCVLFVSDQCYDSLRLGTCLRLQLRGKNENVIFSFQNCEGQKRQALLFATDNHSKRNKRHKCLYRARNEERQPNTGNKLCQFGWLWWMFIRATLKSTACFLCWTEHTWTHATFRAANNTLQGTSWKWCEKAEIWWMETEDWGLRHFCFKRHFNNLTNSSRDLAKD